MSKAPIEKYIPLFLKRFPIRQLPITETVRRVLLTIGVLQGLTVSILLVLAAMRRRRDHEHRFPHIDLQEVRVGDDLLQLYSYGLELYDEMFAAIEEARESIFLETYIWKDDEIGARFRDLLTRKAAEGVQVYVIYDRIGNLVVPHSFYKAFSEDVHVLEYLLLKRPWHLLDPRRYSLDHRKLLIVDGRISFIGGYNIGKLYADEWRDTHLRIRGPAAANLAHSFIDFWNCFCPRGAEIAERYARRFDPLITTHGNDALRLTFPIRDMYIAAIDRADRCIQLTNAYFIPDHILLDALKAAAQRGVDVRVLVPWRSHHIVADWISHGYYQECLDAGIRIFGYRHTMLHAKTCTIDGQWSTVGTANLDRLSSLGNYEINVEIYSTPFANEMEELFASDTSDLVEITPEDWQHRQWYVKASERILAPLRFMM